MVSTFDFMGTADDGQGLPFSTATLPNGKHRLTVKMNHADGSSSVKDALFEVNNTGSVLSPTPTPVSTSAPDATATPVSEPTIVAAPSDPASEAELVVSYNEYRTGSVALDGQTVNGDVYVWVYPDDGLYRADFYIDNPGMSGSPNKTEGAVPFDLAGTHWSGTSLPLDTNTLPDGEHTVTVRIWCPDNSTFIKHAAFTVQNSVLVESGPVVTPTPTATATPVPTATATPVPTVAPTATATPVPTATVTPVPTVAPTATATPMPTATATPVPTVAPTATATPVPTATATPVPTVAPTATATPVPVSLALHVSDLDATPLSASKGAWGSIVEVLVVDSSGNPVAGANVWGTFSQRDWQSGLKSCTTGSDGKCSFTQVAFPSKAGSAEFVVHAVVDATLSYDSAANSDPDGDSNGTLITLSKN
jgi:hypothetical protein